MVDDPVSDGDVVGELDIDKGNNDVDGVMDDDSVVDGD
jgi:hypothetical protein